MNAEIQHFVLFQSTLQNVSFVKLPGDKLGSKALNMLPFFNIVNHMIELL